MQIIRSVYKINTKEVTCMARIIIKTAKGPYELSPQKNSVRLCMCGLSKNQPFCDTSHLKTQDEEDGKVYCYDKTGARHECACSQKGSPEECCSGK